MDLERIQCYNCKSLLCKGKITNGTLEIVCRKCKCTNTITVVPKKTTKAIEPRK